MSIIKPIPFCPSLEPCAKLTPVQVAINKLRTKKEGGLLPSGASNNCGLRRFITTFKAIKAIAASPKPIKGEKNSALATLKIWSTSIPLTPCEVLKNWFINPTPIIEPIMVCELEAGIPKNHVPKFQIMAAIKSANTIANPAPLLTCKISSTGKSAMMP